MNALLVPKMSTRKHFGDLSDSTFVTWQMNLQNLHVSILSQGGATGDINVTCQSSKSKTEKNTNVHSHVI